VVQTRTLLKTKASYDGKTYVANPGQPEYTIKEHIIQPFHELGKHSHPMPIFGFVLSGNIVLVNHETGTRQKFSAGAVIAELVGTVHYAYTEEEPCTLIVWYAGCEGQPEMVPYKEGEETIAWYKHCITESTIAQIIDTGDIDTIVTTFKNQFTPLGGTTEEIEQEYAAVRELIQSDLHARLRRDPAVHSEKDFTLRCIAFRALLVYRISHVLWSPKYIQYTDTESHNARCVALDLHNYAKRQYLVEIHPGVTCGKALYLDHGLGVKINDGVTIGEDCGILGRVVILGEQVEIGDDCTVEAGVLCGAFIKPNLLVQEAEKSRSRRHPKIGNRCFLAEGVQIVGPVTIADDSFISIGRLVTRDYPAKRQ